MKFCFCLISSCSESISCSAPLPCTSRNRKSLSHVGSAYLYKEAFHIGSSMNSMWSVYLRLIVFYALSAMTIHIRLLHTTTVDVCFFLFTARWVSWMIWAMWYERLVCPESTPVGFMKNKPSKLLTYDLLYQQTLNKGKAVQSLSLNQQRLSSHNYYLFSLLHREKQLSSAKPLHTIKVLWKLPLQSRQLHHKHCDGRSSVGSRWREQLGLAQTGGLERRVPQT